MSLLQVILEKSTSDINETLENCALEANEIFLKTARPAESAFTEDDLTRKVSGLETHADCLSECRVPARKAPAHSRIVKHEVAVDELAAVQNKILLQSSGTRSVLRV
jgi:hypothetical protein